MDWGLFLTFLAACGAAAATGARLALAGVRTT